MLYIVQVNVQLKKPGTKVEHHGIKIEFIGQIGEFNDVVDSALYSSLLT